MILDLFWICVSLYVLGGLLMVYCTSNCGWLSVLYAIWWPIIVASGFLVAIVMGIVGIFVKDKNDISST